MFDLNVLDARCMVGRHRTATAENPYTAAELLADMDHHGIAEALVIDCLAYENHPQEGNGRILGTLSGQPRLHPVWGALPEGTPDDQPDGESLLTAMRANRVAALYLQPEYYFFNLREWCIDDLLEPLAVARVPVFLDYSDRATGKWGDNTDWNAVVELCRRWPTLPVIITENRIRRSRRMIYKALDACENLHIELSGYYLHRGIEYVTRRWGSERLIFGSNWPLFNIGMTLTTLTRAEISEQDKRNIAGDNMRRLMRWCAPEHPAVEIAPSADAYVAIGRGAEVPAAKRFFDCHGHLGGHGAHYHLPESSLEETVAEMDRQGIETICVFSFTGVASDETYGNDLVAEAVCRYPERFIGFTLLNPHRGRELMLEELERGAAMGMRGIKLIPYYQGYPEDGPNLEVACEWAHAHKQLILNHSWGPKAHLERLLAKYPDACFINGHMFNDYKELVKAFPNLYICTCPLWDGARACENAVAAYGADRLLFGSDLQDLPIAWGTGPILFAHISEAEKAAILGGNLQRLLERYSLAQEKV